MSAALAHVVTQLPPWPARAAGGHKGDYGRVVVAAGSRGMAGAAVLAASAALRAGAALVTLAVPHEVAPIAAVANPCYMTLPLPQDDRGRLAAAAADALLTLDSPPDVFAAGPGLGRGPDVPGVLSRLLQDQPRPVVLDADGLNAFVGRSQELRRASGPPRVVTPHPGEFGRLVRTDTKTVQANRQELAVQFARDHDLVVVLKGQGTVVTDGRRVYVNTTGNPGMATGGTGDVLTGIIAGLIGQRFEPFEAAQLGVYLHGLAGDLARDQVGEASLIATDLLDFLPAAIRHYRAGG